MCQKLVSILIFISAGATCLLLQSCKPERTIHKKAIVDSVECPKIKVTQDGQIWHKGAMISEDELAELVKKDVEKGYITENSSHMFGVIFIDADDRVSHGRVLEIERIIKNNDGYSAYMHKK
jgi:biopolymer transport protein ExbD